MANRALVDLIASRLNTGLTHPGDPARNIPPRPIALPFGKTAGMSEEMAQLVNSSVTMIAEAIVYLIETDGATELMPREEARAMRDAVSEGIPEGPFVPLLCRCDRERSRPLAMLTMNSTEAIIIDGPALLRGLHQRQIECPHEMMSDA
jgi:hypothetical protein